MQLRLGLASASVSYSTGQFSPIIELRCVPAYSAGTWEIGSKYLFAPTRAIAFRSLFTKRRLRGLEIRLIRTSQLKPETAERLNLSEAKIGELHFVPPQKGEGWFDGLPAALDAMVYVSDALHKELIHALVAGRRPTWLDLEIEKEGVLNFGWEPDGSRKVWKIENETNRSSLDVADVELLFSDPTKAKALHYLASSPAAIIIVSGLVGIVIGLIFAVR